MPALIARLMLSFVAFLLGPITYTISLIVFHGFGTSSRFSGYAFLAAFLISVVITAGAWVGVWRGRVRWTAFRVRMTIWMFVGALLLSLVGGMGVYYLYHPIGNTFGFAGKFNGGLVAEFIWLMTWFGVTLLVWRETRAERVRRFGEHGGGVGLTCPNCGYSFTGLREATCPECGHSYTLDQIVAEAFARRAPLGMEEPLAVGG